MKKLFALFIVLFCWCVMAPTAHAEDFGRPRIGYVFISTTGAIDRSEKITQERDQFLKDVVFKNKGVEIIPSAEARLAAINYFEDKGVTLNPNITRRDWTEVAKKLNADYFMVVHAEKTNRDIEGGFINVSIKLTVEANISIINAHTGEYVLNDADTSKGSSSAVLGYGLPSDEHAANKAVMSILKDLSTKVQRLEFTKPIPQAKKY